MRSLLLGVVFAAAAAAAQAQSNATLSCSEYNTPVITVTYTPGVDAGNPGLFWFGVLTADQQFAEALDITNSWVQYLGGLYPPNQRFDNGLPGTISFSIPFPADSYGNAVTNTSAFVGYTIYAGHGVYTADAQQKVAYRRAALNEIKPQRVAEGKWSASYDDDSNYQWSLIQKNMVDNNKFLPLLQIPFLDCAPVYNN